MAAGELGEVVVVVPVERRDLGMKGGRKKKGEREVIMKMTELHLDCTHVGTLSRVAPQANSRLL
jgi:hypothetical protein